MGRELKRDACPEKYCTSGNFVRESVPIIISLVLVSIFSGSLFKSSGLSTVITILIEVVFIVVFYGFFYVFFSGMKKRLAQTYISVCENGVCGVCPLNGFNNRTFELFYYEITKMVVKGERLFLYSKKGNVALTLKDAQGTASIIKSKNTSL